MDGFLQIIFAGGLIWFAFNAASHISLQTHSFYIGETLKIVSIWGEGGAGGGGCWKRRNKIKK